MNGFHARSRSPLRGARLGGAILALLIAFTTVPGTTAHSPDPLLPGGLYAQNLALRWKWLAGQAPPAWMQAAIRAAAADSDRTRASKAPTFPFDAGGKGDAQYGPGVPCGVNGLACARRWLPDDFLIAFREQGRRFDWGVLNWCQFFANPPNGCYDVENIALDELGHVLVLGHHVNRADQSDYLDAVVQTVSRAKPQAGWNAHAYGRCDVATLQREYGLLQASTPVSTCLSLATTLALSANRTSIAWGESVTFTATLATTSTSAYKRLSAQALASRTVVIQRRAVGTTTWLHAGTMSSGSTVGRYTFTYSPIVTNEWRAVFSKPASEGLIGSASPTIRVTVGPCTGSQCPQFAPSDDDESSSEPGLD